MNPETTIPDKLPSEVMDEELATNCPTTEPSSEPSNEPPNNQDPPSSNHEKHHHRQRTADEKLRDEYRCKVELATYKYRYNHINKQLDVGQKLNELKLENELNNLLFQQKKRKITEQSDLLQSQLDLRAKQDKWKLMVDRQPEYLIDPVQVNPMNGDLELIISDRTIELTGVITYGTSEYVTDLIHYYNNSSQQYPIFLIIDYSPGGSVMSGYRIMKTMEASPAPVYVVVKSFAASMAAMIASMAKYSFIYPNAIMLHHQILTRTAGNLRQHQEQVKDLEEWFRRLAGPFTEKLGTDLATFVEQMYQNNSDGDWREFGDKAVELGWIGTLVNRIRMTGNLSLMDSNEEEGSKSKGKRKHSNTSNTINSSTSDDNISSESRGFSLRPLDHWWIHDPDNYYKLQQDCNKKY